MSRFPHGIKTNNILLTPEGGVAVRLLNKSGSATVKGKVVMPSSTTPKAVELCAITAPGVYMPIGVFYEDGVPDGEMCWVVVSGIAEVYIIENYPIVLGDALRTTTTTPGTANYFTPTPSDSEHWREIGHTLEAKAADDTNRLVKAVLHFN